MEVLVRRYMGFSAYFHSMGYDVGKFREELDGAVAHIKSKPVTVIGLSVHIAVCISLEL